MTIKKYEAIYSRLSTFVFDKDGVRYNIEFKGGINGNVKIGGNFSTSNELLQKSIESDKRFGKEFKLKETHIVADIVKSENDPKQTEETKPTDTTEVTDTETDNSDNKVEVIESVTNKQDARIYFRDKGEQGMSNILSPSTIEKLCLKYNVSFPNLVIK